MGRNDYSKKYYWAAKVSDAKVLLKEGTAYQDVSNEPSAAKFVMDSGQNYIVELGDTFVHDTLDGEMEYRVEQLNGRVKCRGTSTMFEQSWTFEEFARMLDLEDVRDTEFSTR